MKKHFEKQPQPHFQTVCVDLVVFKLWSDVEKRIQEVIPSPFLPSNPFYLLKC